MTDSTLEHIYIDFSKRSVEIVSNEGESRIVTWKWDREGSEGFAETVTQIENNTPAEIRTYCFSEK